MEAVTVDDDVIALAGIYQAAVLVRQVARSDSVDKSALRASLASVLRTDADDAKSVYGGLAGLKEGLKTLAGQLGGPDGKPDREVTGYAACLMYLERKLARLPWMRETLRKEIETSAHIAEQADLEDPTVIANLAHAYSQTISRLSPRILVHGEPRLLNDADNANRIRALLLAGIRAAVLWRQVGGSRLRLFFGRKRILFAARASLKAIEG